MGIIVSLNVSNIRGVIKHPVQNAELKKGLGIVGDAHAGPGIRQVSLLMDESIQEMREKLEEKRSKNKAGKKDKADFDLKPGMFAENLTVRGIDLKSLEIGDEIAAGSDVLLKVSKIGKKCHHDCEIFQVLGYCIMPTQGIFCQVLRGGRLKPGDQIEKV